MEKKGPAERNYMTIGMGVGIAVGTAIGIATDNFATWMPVGLALGLAIGSSFDGKGQKEKDADLHQET